MPTTRSPHMSLAILVTEWSATALLLVALAGCDAERPLAADTQEPLRPSVEPGLRCLTLRPTPWPVIVRAQGSFAADEVSIVGAKVAGRVREVLFDLGDEVAADTPLVKLDQLEFQLQLAHAEAQLMEARAAVGLPADMPPDHLDPTQSPPVREAKAVWNEAIRRRERMHRLLEQNATSQELYDEAVAAEEDAASRYASALNSASERIAQIRVRAAEVELAQQRLTDSITRAPFAGRVQERFAAPGMFVQIGQPLLTLVRTDVLRFRGRMPERHASRLALGQHVVIRAESSPEPIVAKITRISPTIDEVTRSLLFEVSVPNHDGRLRGGTFAEAEVTLDAEATALVVPHAAIVEFAGTEKVWKIVDGAPRECVVQTGQRRESGVEILDGLQVGDVILEDASQGSPRGTGS